MHEIGVREVVHFAGLTFNWETLCMTWLTMAIVILISWLATRNLKMIPTGWQNVVEILVSWLDTQVSSMMGKRGLFLAPFIMSLFMFLLTSNWLGLIPTLSSPTNDLNTTLGLALLVVVLIHVLGVHMKGGHYIAHFFKPTPVFVIINAIEEIAKPITLSFRLFGNILAGEILIIICSSWCRSGCRSRQSSGWHSVSLSAEFRRSSSRCCRWLTLRMQSRKMKKSRDVCRMV